MNYHFQIAILNYGQIDTFQLWKHGMSCIFLWTATLTCLILGCILMKSLISVSNVSPCILASMKHLLVLYRCYYMDNHDGVITHLEPDILECEVKWALESITMNKASGGEGILVELFQILKDDAVKVLPSIRQQFGKLSSGHRTGKGQFSFQSQRKVIPKNVQTTTQLHSSHTLVK